MIRNSMIIQYAENLKLFPLYQLPLGIMPKHSVASKHSPQRHARRSIIEIISQTKWDQPHEALSLLSIHISLNTSLLINFSFLNHIHQLP